MAQIPVNIKSVLDEVTHLNELIDASVSVSLYIDESAPDDLIAFARGAYASTSVNVRLSISYLGSSNVAVNENDDFAVLVAGRGSHIGLYANQLRDAGVPAMVVTTCFAVVDSTAKNEGYPIPKHDIVCPEHVGFANSMMFESVKKISKRVSPHRTSPHCTSPYDNCEEKKENTVDTSGQQSDFVELTPLYQQLLSDRMGKWVIASCDQKSLAMSIAFPFARKPFAENIVNVCAVQNTCIGFVAFIPGTDLPLMTLNQCKMILQIAAAYGLEMSFDRAKEVASIVVGALTCRSIARRMLTYTTKSAIPVFSWVVKGAIGYSGTMVMGRASIEYFESGAGASGLLGLAGKITNALAGVIGGVFDANSGEPQRSAGDKMKDAAQTTGKIAGKLAMNAAPVVKQAGRVAADSFVSGAESMISSLVKKI